MHKCIELIRVSTQAQAGDDKAGIPAQRAINRRTAKAYGLEIVKSIEMADVSGTAVLKAPEMVELLRLIEDPAIHGIITKEFSRLMRPENFSDYALLQAFVDTRTMIYLPDGPIDLSSKTGSLVGVLRAAISGMERREILSRMNDAKEAMRLQGKHAGGCNTLPFGVGYDRAQARWFYTPEAEKLKEAFRLVLESNLPFARIAERLNLSRSNLRYMLQNPIYAGIRQYSQKRDQSAAGYIHGHNGRQGYRRKVLRAQDEVIRVQVMEGLVSQDVFERAQRVIRTRVTRERAVRSQNSPRYLLNGFLACGRCGELMHSKANAKADYYLCRRNGTRERAKGHSCSGPYIMREKIEPKIECVLSELLQDRCLLEDVAAGYAQQPADLPTVNRDAAQQQVKSLSAKRERIMESYFEGIIGRDERDRRLRVIETEIATYGDLLTVTPQQPTVTAEGLAELVSVFTEFPYLQREEKRAILAAAQARIFADGYQIKSVELAAVQPDNDFRNLGLSSDKDSHLPEVAS